MKKDNPTFWQDTTILSVRKGSEVIIAGDGQLTVGGLILKSNVKKIRRIGDGSIVAGFTGSMADGLVLFEQLENSVTHNPHQLIRACVELAKFWRKDNSLPGHNAMMLVVNSIHSLVLTGRGDVFEKEDGIVGIGAGGPYALAAAQALFSINEYSAGQIVEQAMGIAASLCIYTNEIVALERIEIT